MTDFEELLAEVVLLRAELSETRTAMRNMLRPGTVEMRDPEKGYRLNWGKDDKGQTILSPWYPHPEAGGSHKTWKPLAKGEIATAINPGGDPRQGFLMRGGFGGAFAKPSSNLNETVREDHGGKFRESVSSAGDRTVTLAGNEKVTISGSLEWSAAGGGHLA